MGDQISSSLAALRKSSSRLNELTDISATVISDVEDFLSECSFGLSAWVVYREDDNGSHILKWCLSYVRVGSEFRISISNYKKYPKSESGWFNNKPWSDWSRREKLQSIKVLPALLDQINDEVKKNIKEAEAAAKTASSVLDALDNVEGQ